MKKVQKKKRALAVDREAAAHAMVARWTKNFDIFLKK
jgi:hypothetical protein